MPCIVNSHVKNSCTTLQFLYLLKGSHSYYFNTRNSKKFLLIPNKDLLIFFFLLLYAMIVMFNNYFNFSVCVLFTECSGGKENPCNGHGKCKVCYISALK